VSTGGEAAWAPSASAAATAPKHCTPHLTVSAMAALLCQTMHKCAGVFASAD
jgi:hypothetical protein